MFVRRKRNKAGSVSIQVIDKSHGRYQVLKSFGTGRIESLACAEFPSLARNSDSAPRLRGIPIPPRLRGIPIPRIV